MKRLIRKQSKHIFFSAISSTLYALGFFIATKMMGNSMDAIGQGRFDQLLHYVLISLVGIVLWIVAGRQLFINIMNFTGETTRSLQRQMMRRLFWLPTAEYDGQKDDFYLNLFQEDCTTLRTEVLFSIPLVFSYSVQLLIYVVALCFVSVWLFVVTMVFALIPFLLSRFFSGKMQPKRMQISASTEGVVHRLTEVIKGHHTLKRFGTYEAFINQYDEANRASLHARKNLTVFSNFTNAIMRSVGILSNICVVAIGGILILYHKITMGQLISSMFFITATSDALGNAVERYIAVRSGRTLMNKLEAYIPSEEEGEPRAALKLTADSSTHPMIEWKHFSFRFGERVLFRDFNYFMDSGKAYAIIGESGSGKSTFCKVLLKELVQYGGEIRFQGHDLQELSEETLFDSVAVVPQDPVVFRASLKENILLYREDIPDAEARYQQLVSDLHLRALEERTQKGGNVLDASGGEKVRIAIARALISSPSVILFDEPTTGLDKENSTLIKQMIQELTGVTRIVVTHDYDEAYLATFDDVIRMETLR